jgi:hypothetical protein
MMMVGGGGVACHQVLAISLLAVEFQSALARAAWFLKAVRDAAKAGDFAVSGRFLLAG